MMGFFYFFTKGSANYIPGGLCIAFLWYSIFLGLNGFKRKILAHFFQEGFNSLQAHSGLYKLQILNHRGLTMKTISFALQKGGTGKTSISVSTAVTLAEKGKNVLLLDADPQGNATTWLGVDEISIELADVLMKKSLVKEALTKTSVENLSIIPTASLDSDLRLYSKTLATQQPFIIKHLCREVKDDFDFLIIDTSPSFGALEESCFLASDEAVTVLNIDEFSSDGLITFMQNIDSLKERYDTDKPKMNKIVLNSRDLRLIQQSDYLERIKSATDSKLYIVPVDQSFRKAQSVHIPIQYLEGVKKETIAVIEKLANDILGEE